MANSTSTGVEKDIMNALVENNDIQWAMLALAALCVLLTTCQIAVLMSNKCKSEGTLSFSYFRFINVDQVSVANYGNN
jgi:hypothetical protein